MTEGDPRVFRATYSNTEVYECTMNESPIMRRIKDDWVNATQILKCCNFPKAKRTKILEKGVQQGRHEKVQGGFGRFQGTWIPLGDAQRLATTYGITADQAPVLYLDTADPNLDIPAKQKSTPAKEATPIKRRYTKRAKKPEETPTKKPRNDGPARSGPMMGQLGHYPPGQPQFSPNHYQGSPPSQGMFVQSQQPMAAPPPYYQPQQPHPQQQMPPKGPPMMNMTVSLSQQQEYLQRARMQHQGMAHGQHPPPPQQVDFYPPPRQQAMVGYDRMSSQSTNGTWSQEEVIKESDTSMSSAEDGKRPVFPAPEIDESPYAAQLLKFFAEDNAEIPYFIHNPPYNFNINEPIDDEGHTPLHWAASIGNYQMIYLLVQKGANILAVNTFGLNPLSKLISFNNCYELKNFEEVLHLLDKCLSNTDINGRTPLHYLCQFGKVPSKLPSLKYYMAICLNKLQQLSQMNEQVDLLSNVINHQDVNGDTCLHLAAKSRAGELCQMILNVGGRDDLENSGKETAGEIIGGYNLIEGYVPPHKPVYPAPMVAGDMAPGSMGPPEFANGTHPFIDGFPSALATPVQPSRLMGDTPDTQRTTEQSDDMEDDGVRVDKAHLDKLSAGENKENIFTDSTNKMAVSTPAKPHHQPLAAISEHSTPERRPPATPAPAPSSARYVPTVSKHQPQPPQVAEDGTIRGTSTTTLALSDLSKMLSGMISSLATTHAKEMARIDHKRQSLEDQIAAKQQTEAATHKSFKQNLAGGGVSEDQYRTLAEGRELLNQVVDKYAGEVATVEKKVLARYEQRQAAELGSLVQELEESHVADAANPSSGEGDDDELAKEEQLRYAHDLSTLQVRRAKLSRDLSVLTGKFGINEKMYKYRRLISLSCGLKVEDIDSYIDGIEESLVENS
ncbi:hypothetical protein DICA2_D04192 [Diutina catenulata]